jgi:hypothetical protein
MRGEFGKYTWYTDDAFAAQGTSSRPTSRS